MNPRIITGSAKGQKLNVPKKGTRPMSNRTKSALFSMISFLIPNAKVLDLYAGTGALGIECLSRGSKYAVFVDRARGAIECIHENLEKTGFASIAKVIKCSAQRFLNDPTPFKLKYLEFNLIFITPPHADYRERIVAGAGEILKKGGVVVAEHSKKEETADRVGDLKKIDERTYGKTGLSFYTYI